MKRQNRHEKALEFDRIREILAGFAACQDAKVLAEELETAKNAAANQLKSYLGEAESGTGW